MNQPNPNPNPKHDPHTNQQRDLHREQESSTTGPQANFDEAEWVTDVEIVVPTTKPEQQPEAFQKFSRTPAEPSQATPEPARHSKLNSAAAHRATDRNDDCNRFKPNAAAGQQRQPETGPAVRRRPIIERMLSPRSLQIMMSAGGAVLALGFAIWLWSMGVFENPVIAAFAMGSVNLGVLGAGVYLIVSSRYQLAGRGLAFLSALLLPLHLWFYNTQGLIVIAEGGHLWIPALLICGLYALVARLTRDSIFVYQLMGGIVLTGMLFLSGPQLAFLWPVIPTCLFLVVLGTLAIHADRFFTEPQGAFSRDEFGKAFFRAGHGSLLAGLGYLLVGQVAEPLLSWLVPLGNRAIGGQPEINFWSLPILAIACWAYAFSQVNRGRDARYSFAASLIAIWSLLTALQVYSVDLTFNLVALLIASSLLLLQIGLRVFSKQHPAVAGTRTSGLDRSEPGLVISAANSLLGASAIGQAVFCLLSQNPGSCTPIFLAQGLVTALTIGARTELVLGERNQFLSQLRLTFSGLLVSLFGLLSLMSLGGMAVLPAMGIMAGAMFASAALGQIGNFAIAQRSLVALTTGGVVGILISFGLALTSQSIVFGSWPALGIIVAASACLMQVGFVTGRKEAWVASLLVFAVALSQLAILLHITSAYAMIVAISALGIVVSLAAKLFGQFRSQQIPQPQQNDGALSLGMQVGNLLIVAGALASILFVAPKLVFEHDRFNDCGLLFFQLLPLALAYGVNRIAAWQNAFVSLAAAMGVLLAVTFAMTSEVPMVHRAELLVLALGIGALATGHIGWFREQEALEAANSPSQSAIIAERFASVSSNLTLGSILVAVPMVIGMFMFRVFDVESSTFWKGFHEVGGLAVGLTLLGSGILCQIRSTTIAGFTTLAVFVGSLVMLIRLPEALQSVSVMLMVGGGLFFSLGILLSIYRESILSLPTKVKAGEGVFKVLKWR